MIKHLLFLLFLIPFTCIAQNKTSISGSVMDNKGESIPFANVALYKQADHSLIGGVSTDNDGKFIINNINNGTYSLTISFLGYESLSLDTVKVTNTINLGVLRLQEQRNKLDEVQIKAERPTIEQSMGKTTLNIGEDLSNSNETALDLLQYVPSGSTDSDGNALLRGAPATILIDGVPTDLQNALETIPVDAIDKLEIINNPSAKYASQNGAGVINIILKKDNLKGSNGRVNIMGATHNRQQASGNIMLRYNKLSSSSSVNYMHVKDKTNSRSNRINIIDNDYVNNLGLSFKNTNKINARQKFKYQLNKKSAIMLSGNYQKQKMDNDSKYQTHYFNGDGSFRSHNINTTNSNYNKEYHNISTRYNYDFNSNTNYCS